MEEVAAREFNMLICSDDPNSNICRLVRKLDGRVINNPNGKVVLKVYNHSPEQSLGKEMREDLIIFTGRGYREENIRSLVTQKNLQFGYFVNCLPDLDPDPKKNYSQRAMHMIARDLNLLYRHAPCGLMSAELIESDLTNLVNLTLAKDPPEYKKFLVKRFLDASGSMNDIALIFGEETLMKRANENVSYQFEAFPIALAKARISKSFYKKARAMNKTQNQIWMKMSYDTDFLLQQCASLEKDDEFVARFTNIIRKVSQKQKKNILKLAISRNDFMQTEDNFFQVEFNLIASGMGPLTHRHFTGIDRVFDLFQDPPLQQTFELPLENQDSELFLYKAMKSAHVAYGKEDAIIVMICGSEKNVFDQFAPSKYLAKEGIKFVRYSFQDLRVLLKVDETTGIATVLSSEVALFYLRDGYMPHQYEEEDWKVREMIEASCAVKCPDASLQLINMKYFQYILNKKDTWTRFGFTEDEFMESRRSFCGIFTIEDFENDKERMKEHILHSGGFGSFVLKPQREGGANNLFGADILAAIEQMSIQELGAYILMEKISAKTYTNIHCDWKTLKVRDTIDEIGLFHFTLWKDGKELAESEGGSLVRSKMSEYAEGGVSMGYAVINSFEVVN